MHHPNFFGKHPFHQKELSADSMPFSPKRRDLMAPITDLGWSPPWGWKWVAKTVISKAVGLFFCSIRFISPQLRFSNKKKTKLTFFWDQSNFWDQVRLASCCPNWWGPLPIHWRSSLFSSPKHVGSPSHWTSGSCRPKPRWLGARVGWDHGGWELDISFEIGEGGGKCDTQNGQMHLICWKSKDP